jgi:hypothetical protein
LRVLEALGCLTSPDSLNLFFLGLSESFLIIMDRNDLFCFSAITFNIYIVVNTSLKTVQAKEGWPRADEQCNLFS